MIATGASPTPTIARSDLDREVRSVVARRLGTFAVGWLVPMLIWVAAFSRDSARARLPAIATLAAQGAALGVALLAIRRDREASASR